MSATDMPPPTAAEKTAAARYITRYIVLEQDAGGDWCEIADVEDANSEGAIRKAISGKTAGGTFVAIPARSWHPVRVTVETVSRVKLDIIRTVLHEFLTAAEKARRSPPLETFGKGV